MLRLKHPMPLPLGLSRRMQRLHIMPPNLLLPLQRLVIVVELLYNCADMWVSQSFGKEFTGEPPSATEKLQTQAKDITNTAVSEGKQDVNAATATGAGYIDQAKAVAVNAVQTAQVCTIYLILCCSSFSIVT
jgi:hypothetical protein